MESRKLIQRFHAEVAQRGLKLTSQRRVIAEVFFSSDDHVSLLDILERTRERQAGIGYATVYRTMRLMTEAGLAEEHHFGEAHTRYEPARDGNHHDHIICTECGRIVEFEDEAIETRQERIAKDHGFQVTSHRHEIYGRCLVADCEWRPTS